MYISDKPSRNHYTFIVDYWNYCYKMMYLLMYKLLEDFDLFQHFVM